MDHIKFEQLIGMDEIYVNVIIVYSQFVYTFFYSIQQMNERKKKKNNNIQRRDQYRFVYVDKIMKMSNICGGRERERESMKIFQTIYCQLHL